MSAAQINRLLLGNAALGNFLAGTSRRIFAVSLPTVASPETLVRSMNFSFFFGGSVALAAMGCSAPRGERAAGAHWTCAR